MPWTRRQIRYFFAQANRGEITMAEAKRRAREGVRTAKRRKATKGRSMTIGDLFAKSGRDASGHEHGSDGKFCGHKSHGDVRPLATHVAHVRSGGKTGKLYACAEHAKRFPNAKKLSEKMVAAALLEKAVRDASGHMHGDDGKFVTMVSAPHEHGDPVRYRVASNGTTIGQVLHHKRAKSPTPYHSHDYTGAKISEHGSRDQAERQVETTYITASRHIVKHPNAALGHIRDAYMPGAKSKTDTREMPTHQIVSMVRDAFMMGHRFGNPVKASRENPHSVADANHEKLMAILGKTIGAIDVNKPDDKRTVNAESAAKAIKSAWQLGLSSHARTKKSSDFFGSIRKFEVGGAAFKGSFEHLLRAMIKPACAASPCSNKPEYEDNGCRVYEPYKEGTPSKHYLEVVATFPDHVYVRCSDEAKLWKIPYSIENDTIKCGSAEEAAITLQPKEDAEGDEPDALSAVA